MVDYLEEYKSLLQRGVSAYSDLIQLYAPDKQKENDWADITASETTTERNGMLERLANPKLSPLYSSTLVSSIRHYLDSHWADYQEYPIADAKKRERVEHPHAELESIMDAAGSLNNALREGVSS